MSLSNLATRAAIWCLQTTFGWMSWEASDRLGFAIGRLAFRLGVRRKVAIENLTQVFNSSYTRPDIPRKSPAEIEALARKVYENVFALWLMFVRGHKMDARFFEEHWFASDESLENLKRAHSAGRGVLAIGGHIGLWDVALMKVGRLGYPNALIGKNIKNPVVNQWTIDMRSIHGEKTLPPRNSRAAIVEELKAGRFVTQAVDQNMTARLGTFVEVMGRLASTVKSTPGIIRETGCSVIYGYARRAEPGRYELIVGPDIPWISDPDPVREDWLNAQNHSSIFEREILKRPEDWLWLHRRWKRRPKNDPPPPHHTLTPEAIMAVDVAETD